jgi:hypothetical protein
MAENIVDGVIASAARRRSMIAGRLVLGGFAARYSTPHKSERGHQEKCSERSHDFSEMTR